MNFKFNILLLTALLFIFSGCDKKEDIKEKNKTNNISVQKPKSVIKTFVLKTSNNKTITI